MIVLKYSKFIFLMLVGLLRCPVLVVAVSISDRIVLKSFKYSKIMQSRVKKSAVNVTEGKLYLA